MLRSLCAAHLLITISRSLSSFPAPALYAVTIMEFSVFTIVGLVCYYYNGQFTGAPAVTNLKPLFKKIAFSFVFPTTVIIGVIYASVVAKFIFHRLFYGTRHFNNYTTLGWIGWVGAVLVTWVGGWIVGESIPFFGTLLSLMSALFDGFFGFIFWVSQTPKSKWLIFASIRPELFA